VSPREFCRQLCLNVFVLLLQRSFCTRSLFADDLSHCLRALQTCFTNQASAYDLAVRLLKGLVSVLHPNKTVYRSSMLSMEWKNALALAEAIQSFVFWSPTFGKGTHAYVHLDFDPRAVHLVKAARFGDRCHVGLHLRNLPTVDAAGNALTMHSPSHGAEASTRGLSSPPGSPSAATPASSMAGSPRPVQRPSSPRHGNTPRVCSDSDLCAQTHAWLQRLAEDVRAIHPRIRSLPSEERIAIASLDNHGAFFQDTVQFIQSVDSKTSLTGSFVFVPEPFALQFLLAGSAAGRAKVIAMVQQAGPPVSSAGSGLHINVGPETGTLSSPPRSPMVLKTESKPSSPTAAAGLTAPVALRAPVSDHAPLSTGVAAADQRRLDVSDPDGAAVRSAGVNRDTSSSSLRTDDEKDVCRVTVRLPPDAHDSDDEHGGVEPSYRPRRVVSLEVRPTMTMADVRGAIAERVHLVRALWQCLVFSHS